jgi:hypothetical protein
MGAFLMHFSVDLALTSVPHPADFSYNQVNYITDSRDVASFSLN